MARAFQGQLITQNSGQGNTNATNNNNTFTTNIRTGGSGRAQRNNAATRAAEHEREQRLREAENKRIQGLNDQISFVKQEISEIHADKTLDVETRANRLMSRGFELSSLSEQIARIHKDRIEREQLALERELTRMQQEVEERAREQEEKAAESRLNNSTEDLESFQQRETIRSLTIMSARIDSIQGMEQSRARLASEANQLEKAIDSGNSARPMPIETGETSTNVAYGFSTVMVNAGRVNPNDFRNSHLQKLNTNIARLDTAILTQVGAMYRDSQVLQEAQLRAVREHPSLQNQSEEDENIPQHEYAYESVIDALL